MASPEDIDSDGEGWGSVGLSDLNLKSLNASASSLEIPVPEQQHGKDSGLDFDSDPDGWASLVSAEAADHAQQQPDLPDDAGVGFKMKRKRGRPPGVFGSHAFRKSLKEAETEEEKKLVSELQLSKEVSKKSRSEICAQARLAKRIQVGPNHEQKQQQPLRIQITDSSPSVGTPLQQFLLSTAKANFDSSVAGVSDFGHIHAFFQQLFQLSHSSEQLQSNTSNPLKQEGPSHQDDEVDNIVKCMAHFFQPYRPYCSISRDSTSFDVNERQFSRNLVRVAAASQNLCAKLWGNMLKKIQNLVGPGKSHDPLMFVARFRFDETPSKISLQDLNSQDSTTALTSAAGAASSKKPVTKQLAKILQTEFGISVLLRNKGTREPLLISGRIPVPLQVLDRQTGPNLAAALENTFQLPELENTANQFNHKLFLFCADEFGANDVAQRRMQCVRQGWARISTLCDVHKASTCQGRVFDLAGPSISAVINFALSMTPAGSLGKLQGFLSDILTARFELRIGEPPYNMDAIAHKQDVLDIFCATPDTFSMEVSQSTASRQRLRFGHKVRQAEILKYFMNDDWRDGDKVIHWCKSGQYTDFDEALQLFLQYVVPALLPCAAPLFPRSRWLGADQALDYVGLLCHCHNLFEPLIAAWTNYPHATASLRTADAPQSLECDDIGWEHCAITDGSSSVGKPSKLHGPLGSSASQTGVPKSDAPAANCSKLSAEPDAGPQSAAENRAEHDDADPEPKPVEFPGTNPDDANANANASFDWHKYHEQLKTSVGEWVFGHQAKQLPKPQTMMSLMRQYLSPILRLLIEMLHRSSFKWSRDQCQKSCKGLKREYRFLLVWQQQDTISFFERVLPLLTSPPKAIEKSDQRCDVGVLAFTMLSRLACSVFQLIHWRWGKYPYKLWSALESSEKAAAVFHEPRCLKDEFSQMLCKAYNSEQSFCSESCRQILETVAMLGEVDIAAIERQHTISRKVIQTRSMARAVTLKALNADWLLRNHAQNKANVLSYFYFDSRDTRRKFARFQREAKKKVKKRKKRRGGGGAWRAFCSEMSRGVKLTRPVVKAMAALYNALSPEDKQKFKDIGALATVSHRKGFQAFGSGKKKGLGKSVKSRTPATRVQKALPSMAAASSQVLPSLQTPPEPSAQMSQEHPDDANPSPAASHETLALKLQQELSSVSPPTAGSVAVAAQSSGAKQAGHPFQLQVFNPIQDLLGSLSKVDDTVKKHMQEIRAGRDAQTNDFGSFVRGGTGIGRVADQVFPDDQEIRTLSQLTSGSCLMPQPSELTSVEVLFPVDALTAVASP